ncbi:BTB/POZ and MATH domain-containing protein 1-like isoform X1 [Panicum virgatum]|uniref:Uncharacterized protein n=2 Tax=Panicum virgatum TaxID=38727 RepID=A0A8T0RI90_PANVG|nr:BTB/POZ and MATH domain-containing protein 1-like isoform X1 [Panicum virgatum]KAG2585114.1 hypothetical protein PVAP13_6KG370400 [Panicum virgatum]
MKQLEAKMSGAGFLELKLHYADPKTIDLVVGDAVSSEVISAGGYLWKINCYPRGYREEDRGQYVSMYLELISDSIAVKTICQVFLQGRGGEPSFSHEKKLVKVYSDSEDSNCWGWNQFLKRSVLESTYLSNGWVTFLCSIIVLGDETIIVPPSNIGSDLSLLLDRKVGTDVSFIVKGETIQAHRAILAARSQVFQAELFGSMADSKSASITLQDIEPATFKAMLGFMYTDELPEDDEFGDAFIEIMQHLLAAADRYAIDRLKFICARKLWDNISEDTFAQILVCAETYNCPVLKSRCFDYFATDNNLKNIIFTDGFLWLLQEFRPLAAELKARVGM